MTEQQQEEEKKDEYEFYDELGLDDFQEYEDLFQIVGDYKQGKATREALKEKLFELRFRKLSDEDLDRIVGETEFTKDGLVSIFSCIIFLKKIIDAGTKEKFQRIVKREGMGLFRIVDCDTSRRKARPYSDKEKNKYAKIINKLLRDDPDCKNKIPIDPKGDDLYNKCRDGIILVKLINLCEPNTVNEADINKDENMNVYAKYDNLKKALDGAKAIGCTCETVPDDVLDKNKVRTNDLLGEILARLNAKKKDIEKSPETPKMAEGGETPEQIAALPINDFLMKWFNHNLKAANHPDQLTNWDDDLKDSVKFTVLLHQLDPVTCDTKALDCADPLEKAKKVINNARKMGAETNIAPEDIAEGNAAMNRLLASEIYNAVNNMNAGTDDSDPELCAIYADCINKELCDDAPTRHLVPINPTGNDLFDKLKDGVVLGKLIALADKDAIDEDALKTGEDLNDDDKNNNLGTVVDACEKLRCPHKIKIGDLGNGRKKPDQDILGDVLGRVKVPPKVIREDPDADDLVQDGETKEDLATKVPVEDFVKRWVNKHLKLAGHPKQVENLDDDLRDGEVYTVLLNDIAPNVCDKSPLDESDPEKRMEKVLDNAKKMGVDTSATPKGLVSGSPEIGKLFLGEIYNTYANPFDANEKECYCKMINKLLANEPEAKEKLPLNPENNEVFKKIKDGVLLTKLVNLAAPGTIDERVIVKDPSMTKDDKLNNLNLVINSAKSIGCMVECKAEDVLDEVRTKDVDLLYQILKPIALKKVTVQDFPQLLRLKEDKEENEELLMLGPEDFLKRWFNMHLTNAKHPNKLNNFSDDVKDSEKYTILLNQLDNSIPTDGLSEPDLKKRAAVVLQNAPKIGAEVYIKDEDIPSGNEHLNTLFTCELFMANNGMGEPTAAEKMTASKILEDDDEGGREERSFRTWINSLKLEGVRKVNNLYEECRSAILLLKMIDKIKPGTVQWKKVELKTKNPFKVGVNCQEVIDASKRSGYSIISIGNKDIQEGKKKHILAIVWQLMKAHTLSIIGEKSEEELIQWANTKVSAERKIKSLKEKKLNDGLFWIELLAAIEPRCIRWDLVVKDNPDDKGKEMNAKYALSVARGLGAMIFVVWEDITEVKSKLLLTFLASLYDVAKNREKKN